MYSKPRFTGKTKSPSGDRSGPGDRKREYRPGGAREERSGGGRFFKKKICRFCAERAILIDFKDTERLIRFLTEKGKIVPRRITGNCAKHQRIMARAIKRSRHSALTAFQID